MHWMDRVQVWALKQRYCFREGWGDLSIVPDVARSFEQPGPIDAIDIDWGPPTRVLGADLRTGTFVSPVPGLPAECQQSRVWWLHPADQEVRGAVVAFASWADEGPTIRGRILGPLVRDGVSILIMENPYYGVRRPEGQVGPGLRTVSEFIHMQGSVMLEGRALVRWMQRTLGVPCCIFGFSMGGHIGGAIASSLRKVPLVLVAPPLSPSLPFVDGPLGRCVDWDALGGTTRAWERWQEIMDLYDIRVLPGPHARESVRLFGCSRDGLVASDHTLALSEAWSIPVTWFPVGHVGVVFTQGRHLRNAVKEVLGIPRRDRRWLGVGQAALTEGRAATR